MRSLLEWTNEFLPTSGKHDWVRTRNRERRTRYEVLRTTYPARHDQLLPCRPWPAAHDVRRGPHRAQELHTRSLDRALSARRITERANGPPLLVRMTKSEPGAGFWEWRGVERTLARSR